MGQNYLHRPTVVYLDNWNLLEVFLKLYLGVFPLIIFITCLIFLGSSLSDHCERECVGLLSRGSNEFGSESMEYVNLVVQHLQKMVENKLLA